MRSNQSRVYLVFLILCFFALDVKAQEQVYKFNWPNFRGPNRDSITSEAGWNPRGLEALNIK